MPLKLQIAISRKIGQPNFGSRGASVGLELDEELSLLEQPPKFRERVAALFNLANQSLLLELHREHAADRPTYGGNGGEPRPATPAQIRAIHAIARRQQLDLIAELRGQFGVNRPHDLTLEKASQMIDRLQPSANGLASAAGPRCAP